jgi:hypothetical protein
MESAPEDAAARRFTSSPAWIALGFSLFGGVTSQPVAENACRVELLEAADRQRGDALGRIDSRTARIEATLCPRAPRLLPQTALSEGRYDVSELVGNVPGNPAFASGATASAAWPRRRHAQPGDGLAAGLAL